jgi:cytochrome c-type biogenesis protein CcmH
LLLLVPLIAAGVYAMVGLPSALTENATASSPGHGGDLDALAAGLAAKLETNPDDVDGWRLLASTYEYLGQTEAARAAQARAEALEGGQGTDAAITTLEQHLVRYPKDAEGWAMLGRSYQSRRRFDEAASAFARSTELQPDAAAWWADRADAQAAAKGGQLAPVAKWIDTALRLDADEPKALWLAGTLALERGNKSKALKHWRHLERVLPADDPRLTIIRDNIAELAPGETGVAPFAIQGTVALAPAVVAQVNPGDTLFVFARAPNGPPMPIAVWRGAAEAFPLRFSLDATTTLSPDRPLDAFDSVMVGARISRSGNARAMPGDLESSIVTVRRGPAGELHLVIDRPVS